MKSGVYSLTIPAKLVRALGWKPHQEIGMILDNKGRIVLLPEKED